MADEDTTIAAAEPSQALRKQLESDAGPHASPDQLRAAEKRRAAAAAAEGFDAERSAPEPKSRTQTRKPAARD